MHATRLRGAPARYQTIARVPHPDAARMGRGARALADKPPVAPGGRPYFVMELVKGVSITKYCDTERLGTRDRLDLFVRVATAHKLVSIAYGMLRTGEVFDIARLTPPKTKPETKPKPKPAA